MTRTENLTRNTPSNEKIVNFFILNLIHKCKTDFLFTTNALFSFMAEHSKCLQNRWSRKYLLRILWNECLLLTLLLLMITAWGISQKSWLPHYSRVHSYTMWAGYCVNCDLMPSFYPIFYVILVFVSIL